MRQQINDKALLKQRKEVESLIEETKKAVAGAELSSEEN